MQVPNNLVSGQQFRQGVVNKINDILAYLRSQKVVGDNDTISVNQCVNGVTVNSIIKPGVSTGEVKHHPFKLYFYNIEGNIYCAMEQGKIYFRTRWTFNTSEKFRVWTQTPTEQAWANTWRAIPKNANEGQYTLWGFIKGTTVDFFFAPKEGNGTFNYSINNEDFLSFKVAEIKKEKVYTINSGTTSNSPFIDSEGNLYTVTKQYIFGDLIFEELGENARKADVTFAFNFPSDFSGYLDKISDLTVPTISVSLKKNFFVFNNEKEKIIVKNEGISFTPSADFEGNLYSVLTFHDDANYPTFTFSMETTFPYQSSSTQLGPIFDKTTGNYKFLIARIHLEKPYIQKDVVYYFDDNIFLDFIKGKTKISNLDTKFQYLDQKLTADRKYINWNSYPNTSDVISSSSSSNQSAYSQINGYLGVERTWNYDHQAIRYVFDYPHIQGYNSSKFQKLIHHTSYDQALQWREDELFQFGEYLTSSSVDSYEGKLTTVNVNKNKVFSDFRITGGGAASVTGSGNNWTVYVNPSSGGGGGSSVSITGTSPVSVTGGGNSYNVALSLPSDGILIVSSGTFTSLPLPTGNAVLISQNGALSWAPFGDCSSASSSSN